MGAADTADARVVLGVQACQGPDYQRRGIGRYASSYVNALYASHSDRIVQIDVDPDLPPPPGLVHGELPLAPAPEFSVAPSNVGPLVYHVLAPFQPWPIHRLWPRWARRSAVALAVTLYDLIPLRNYDHYLRGPANSGYVPRLALVRSADAVLAISDAAASDAIDLLGLDERRVHVIGCASPAVGRASSNGSARAGLPGAARAGGILVVSGDDWRKNTERLVDAYAGLAREVRASHALTIVGALSADARARIEAQAGKRGAAADVVITGEIPDEQLDALRRTSVIAVSPSLDEGFGLPVLEALEAGLPTFVSDIPSHRVLVRADEARFDPTSTEAIRGAMERALTDASLRDRLRQAAATWIAPFTWDRVASRAIAAYDAAATLRRRRRRPGLRSARAPLDRLAIVTPSPPSPTGVASYSARLVEALAGQAEIDVYTEEDVPQAEWVPHGARARPARHFDWHRELVGTVLPPLFCLGNSSFHIRAWELLMHHRGDVLLHDARLDWLYRALEGHRLLGAGGLPARIALIEGCDRSDVASPDVLMVGEVVDRARRVFVHTNTARDMVLAKRPHRAPDVIVVPFAMPVAASSSPEREPALIASFGYQHSADLVLDAVTHVLRADPAARLVCAGAEAAPGDLERLRRIASSRGIGERVEFAGWVDDERYRTLLKRAAVAVQMRDFSQGEMSATVADCLAAGLPTIVNDAGAYREFPSDAVMRLTDRPGAEAVAAALRALLAAPDRRAALSAAGLRYAGAHAPARAAHSLLSWIRAA
jgi:glycosyltransferase involved in cell wall biosynthesis